MYRPIRGSRAPNRSRHRSKISRPASRSSKCRPMIGEVVLKPEHHADPTRALPLRNVQYRPDFDAAMIACRISLADLFLFRGRFRARARSLADRALAENSQSPRHPTRPDAALLLFIERMRLLELATARADPFQQGFLAKELFERNLLPSEVEVARSINVDKSRNWLWVPFSPRWSAGVDPDGQCSVARILF